MGAATPIHPAGEYSTYQRIIRAAESLYLNPGVFARQICKKTTFGSRQHSISDRVGIPLRGFLFSQ